MKSVKIVGGGLTGILAAFEAHALGCRDITLFERFDGLGGVALPKSAHGMELRDGCIYLGPKGDAMRTMLEEHGVAFEDFENRFCSVSPGGAVAEDFGGPSLAARDFRLRPGSMDSLASRIANYPEDIEASLVNYCRWHLGTDDLASVHESAAIPLAINRVFPLGADIVTVASAKRDDPLHDELYGIPRHMWGHRRNVTASLPKGGFKAMFDQCLRALHGLGVAVHEASLVSPRAALLEHTAGEVLVWAANPTPLFKPMGLATPELLKKTFATYVFPVRWTGPSPYYIQNFTAEGSIFRLYFYESGGQTLMAVECVELCDDAELRRDVHRLIEPILGVSLSIGEQISCSVQPRWIYHSVESMTALKGLRERAAGQMGAGFVAGAWEPYAKSEKFAEVNAGLAAALGEQRAVSAA